MFDAVTNFYKVFLKNLLVSKPTRNPVLFRKSSGMTVSSIEHYWTQRFSENNISEANNSIKLILANILGLKNVIKNLL